MLTLGVKLMDHRKANHDLVRAMMMTGYSIKSSLPCIGIPATVLPFSIPCVSTDLNPVCKNIYIIEFRKKKSI